MIEKFKKEGVSFVAASLIIKSVLPLLLCGLFMKLKGDFISNNTIIFINIISFIITYALLVIGLNRYLEKGKVLNNFINCLPLVISYSLILLIDIFTSSLDNYLIFYIIHCIISAFILSLGIYISLANINDKRIVFNVKNVLKLILYGVIIYIIPTIVMFLLNLISVHNTFAYSLFIFTINGIIESILVILLINKYIDLTSNEGIKIENKIIYIVGTSVVLLTLVFDIIYNNISYIKSVDNYMSYSIASGDYFFDNMDYNVAKSFYDEARNYKCAYTYLLSGESDKCEGSLYETFKLLKKDNNIELLKEKVNNKVATNFEIEVLLKLMNEEGEDTSSIINYLINNVHFTKVGEFEFSEKDKEKILDELDKYTDDLILRESVNIYTKYLEEGSINAVVLSLASNLANEYKDNLFLQKLVIDFYIEAPASTSGSSSVVDNFVNLTKEEMSSKSEEEILKYKTYVAYAYEKCDASSKEITFLEEFKPNIINSYIGDLLMLAYKSKGDYEKAEELALKTVNIDKTNSEALAFLSIYYLQSDLDKSIDYAIKLASTLENGINLRSDISLGMYAQYLFGYYEPMDSRFCPYNNYYKDMSDEQKERLTSIEIINAYMKGRNLSSSNSEEYLKVVNETLNKYNYLTYLYYYRGSYYVKAEEWNNALNDLLKAIELGNTNPFIYSELGFAYEGVGDLNNSLEAFEMASKRVSDLGLVLTYNFNSIQSYLNVYINNAKHAMYESEGEE